MINISKKIFFIVFISSLFLQIFSCSVFADKKKSLEDFIKKSEIYVIDKNDYTDTVSIIKDARVRKKAGKIFEAKAIYKYAKEVVDPKKEAILRRKIISEQKETQKLIDIELKDRKVKAIKEEKERKIRLKKEEKERKIRLEKEKKEKKIRLEKEKKEKLLNYEKQQKQKIKELYVTAKDYYREGLFSEAENSFEEIIKLDFDQRNAKRYIDNFIPNAVGKKAARMRKKEKGKVKKKKRLAEIKEKRDEILENNSEVKNKWAQKIARKIALGRLKHREKQEKKVAVEIERAAEKVEANKRKEARDAKNKEKAENKEEARKAREAKRIMEKEEARKAEQVEKAAKREKVRKACAIKEAEKAAKREEARKICKIKEAEKAAKREEVRKACEIKEASKAAKREEARKACKIKEASKAAKREAARKACEVKEVEKAAKREAARKACEEKEAEKAAKREVARKACEEKAAAKAASREVARKVCEEKAVEKAIAREVARKAKQIKEVEKAASREEARKACEVKEISKAKEILAANEVIYSKQAIEIEKAERANNIEGANKLRKALEARKIKDVEKAAKREEVRKAKQVKQAEKAAKREEARKAKQAKEDKQAVEREEARKTKQVKDAEKAVEKEELRKAKQAKDAEKAVARENVRKAKQAKDAEKAAAREEARKVKQAKDAEKVAEKEEARKVKQAKDAEKAAEREEVRKVKQAKDAEKAVAREKARKIKELKEAEKKEETRKKRELKEIEKEKIRNEKQVGKEKQAEEARKKREVKEAEKAVKREEARKIKEAKLARKSAKRAEVRKKKEARRVEKSARKAARRKKKAKQQTEVKKTDELLIMVNDIIFSGNTVFTEEILKQIVSPDLGKKLSLSDLRLIADQIKQYYYDGGYFLTQVVIPEQNIKKQKGVVEFIILEGFLDKFIIKGNKRYDTQRIRQAMYAVAKGEPICQKNIERSLLVLNSFPGINTGCVFRAGEEIGSTDIVLNVEEENRVQGALEFNNFGRSSTGKYRISPELSFPNITGRGDLLFVKGLSAVDDNDLYYGYLYYSTPIGLKGLQFKTYGSRGSFAVGEEFESLNINSRTVSAGVGFSYPLILKQKLSVGFEAWLEGKDFEQTSFDGSVKLIDDKIRKIRIELLNIDKLELKGRTLFNLGMQMGIGEGMGAMEKHSLYSSRSFAKADNDFTKITSSIARVQNINNKLTLIARIAGQYSYNTLVAGEQWSVGGMNSVHGHESGVYLGDNGFTTNLELRYTLYSNKKSRYQLLLFGDQARVHIKRPALRQDSNYEISGTGVGLYADINDKFELRLDYGIPLGKDTGDNSVFYFQGKFKF